MAYEDRTDRNGVVSGPQACKGAQFGRGGLPETPGDRLPPLQLFCFDSKISVFWMVLEPDETPESGEIRPEEEHGPSLSGEDVFRVERARINLKGGQRTQEIRYEPARWGRAASKPEPGLDRLFESTISRLHTNSGNYSTLSG